MKVYSIKKTTNLSIEEIITDINKGGKFISYGYCISIVALIFRLTSSPHFIKSTEKPSKYRLKYNILSLLLGWWGLPWGPIYTIDMLRLNLKKGGIDITEEILEKIIQQHPTDTHKPKLDIDLTITYVAEELTD